MIQKVNIFILFFVFLGTSPRAGAQHIYKRLYANKCDSLIKANETNPNFVILDVRTHGEWIGEHLEGSINRSTGDSDFQQRLDELPRHKIYLLHCRSGSRSAGAFAKMKNLGFEEVYEMIGGIIGWKNYGLPTTSELAPRLMLVSKTDSLENTGGADTINITITNRANDVLTFTDAHFDDFHDITHNFDSETSLEGAEDYTFSIYHEPGYSGDDSTTVYLHSNGGELEINIVFKNGMILDVEPEFLPGQPVVYPNPARHSVYLKGVGEHAVRSVSLFSLSGKMMWQQPDYNSSRGINVSDLNAGIYLLRVETGKETVVRKIMIKKTITIR